MSADKEQKERQIAAFILAGALALIGIFFVFINYFDPIVADTVSEVPPIYEHNYNELQIEVFAPEFRTHEDTGKIIVHMPVRLTNDSDHAFIFNTSHFYYNGSEFVSTIFDVEDDEVSGKIKRGEIKDGTIIATLETRELSEVKTINPTFSIKDMKTEKDIDLRPVIDVQSP